MEQYNVYLCLVDNFKPIKHVGEVNSFGAARALENQVMDGLNISKYFPLSVLVGCERDLELNEELE